MNLLIYGATGYTGGLVTKAAKELGLHPIVAGRDAQKVTELAEGFALEHCAFSLDSAKIVDQHLNDIRVVLNCAGPFSQTSRKLAEACIRASSHYLDIAGEVQEFESVRELDERARNAGVMLMPGVGFGVVPTDCLAVYLKRHLPSATRLILAFETEGGVSRGTLATMLPNLHRAGVTRRDGELVPIRAGQVSRYVNFGRGHVKVVNNPWRADLTTAYISTGIPDIETYTAFPKAVRALMQAAPYIGWAIGSRPVQAFLRRTVAAAPPGPSEQERAEGFTTVWGQVDDDEGARCVATLRGPEAYAFTALTASAVAKRVLDGRAEPGFHTPGEIFGPELVLRIRGVNVADMT